MQPTNSIKKIPVPLALVSLGAAILLAATVLVGLYLGGQTQKHFKNIDESWRLYSDQVERRGELLSQIRQHLGYGGIIHNFKNYVLRKDKQYLEQFEKQIANFFKTTADYRANDATNIERKQLDRLEQTINLYKEKLPIVIQAEKENWPPARTDRLVKVDDREALEAIKNLDQYWRNKRYETNEKIAQSVITGENLITTGFSFLGALAVVASIIFALFWYLQRQLHTTIRLLSHELSERKAAEHETKKFHRAVEQSPATIIITDTSGHIEYVNKKFCDLTGYSPQEMHGKSPKELQSGDTPEEEYKDLFQKISNGEQWHGIFRNIKKNGDSYWAKTAIVPLRDDENQITHFIGLGEDITETQKVQEQMYRAQKMEAIGLLASGVAHDFNNVLTTILGNVHMARLDVPPDHDIDEELEQIEIAAKRAQHMVGRILTFARRQPGKATSIRVADILNEVCRMMQASVLPTTKIICQIEDHDLCVKADATRLMQVIMNLCANAADAIHTNGGTITLKAQETPQAAGDPAKMCISISDNGPGIAKEIQDKIFEPFFTTKKSGKGTGLGLSVVATLVEDMNGSIALESAPNNGANFSILLPKCEMSQLPSAVAEKMISGTGKLLLIDDQADVVATCAKLLRRLNYEVDTFTNPIEALETFKNNPETYSLIMTDYMMPEMNGEVLCNKIHKLRPHCPIIIYSAYQPTSADLDQQDFVRFLEKPIDPITLSKTVHDFLAECEAN